MSTLSPLCQLNGGCMGCCGHNYDSNGKVKLAIATNTKEFDEMPHSTKEELLVFRNRTELMDLRNGVCKNLIEKEGCFFCPLHPLRNEGDDLRVGHCNVNYLCQTTKEFNKWDEDKKQNFLKFVEEKQLDSISYSMKMDDNSLLQEFILLNDRKR